MKRAILTIVFFVSSSLACSGIAWAQSTIDAFGAKIIFTKPNEEAWTLVKEINPSENSKGVRTFKYVKITGDKGATVEPVISLIVEKVMGTSDAMAYSLNGLKRMQESSNLTWDVLGGYPAYSSDRHSIVYKGSYTRSGAIHKVYLCYILSNGIGVVVIADSTKDDFSQVDDDMLAFIKSVVIQAQP